MDIEEGCSTLRPTFLRVKLMNEDEISTANTEDLLLRDSAQDSTESIDSLQKEMKYFGKTSRLCTAGSPCHLIAGLCLILWGFCANIWTPFDLAMDERLRMRPGLPPFDWWKDPPDEVMLKVHAFNVTNSEEFLSDPSVKLNVQEIGPLVYLEKLFHTNVTFNENGTMSYRAIRKAVFLPEKNTIDLDSMITIPNWGMLGMASYLADQSFFIKLGFNLLIRSVKPTPFVTLPIRDFLWNFSDPMLDAGQNIAPFLVPMKNLGILSRIYSDFENEVTVFIGTKHGHDKFFLIDKYDGSEYLPNYGESCADKVAGASEGVAYPQYLTKNFTLKYWRKTLCKNALLKFHNETARYGVNGYRFELPANTFDRTAPAESDCYKSEPALPSGLSDISKCHYGLPLATSFPHFLYGDPAIRNYVTGLTPDETKHGSFALLEPTTGIPLEATARSQSNLVVRELKGFHSMPTRFSNMSIPMFWLEYHQMGLPFRIAAMMYFQVIITPYLQRILSFAAILAGVYLIYAFFKARRRSHLDSNKILIYETEVFLEGKEMKKVEDFDDDDDDEE